MAASGQFCLPGQQPAEATRVSLEHCAFSVDKNWCQNRHFLADAFDALGLAALHTLALAPLPTMSVRTARMGEQARCTTWTRLLNCRCCEQHATSTAAALGSHINGDKLRRDRIWKQSDLLACRLTRKFSVSAFCTKKRSHGGDISGDKLDLRRGTHASPRHS